MERNGSTVETEHSARTVTDGLGETSDRLAVRIAMAVAEATGRGPLDRPPLQQYVDVDSLERLFDSGGSDLEVSFSYDGVEVTVHSGGTVRIEQ